ncbi:MAG: pyridoxal-phosphate dependent enzyme [Candidatus Altarchaeaceae archaeon]
MKSVDDTKEKLSYVTHLECLNCGEKYTLKKLKEDHGTILVNICYDSCMGPLDVKYDYEKVKEILTESEIRKREDNIWKLKELLPIEEILIKKDMPFTPLVKSKEIGDELGIELYFKLDSESSFTHSFKDRPVALAFNKALEAGYDKVYVASTGNLAIATAYFAKETRMSCKIYVPKSLGEVKKNAIRQYLSNPEDLIELDCNYDETNIKAINDCEKANEEEIKRTGRMKSFVPNSSFRPYYKEGSKTSGYEIALQLKDKISNEKTIHIFYPLGSGALFSSAYKGIEELKMINLFDNNVRMWGVQPENCSPIIDAIPTGEIIPLRKFDTMAKSIAIGNPGSGYQALDVMRKSNGGGFKVSEKDILKCTIDLYFKEKIFSQFVGGVTLAGLIKAVEEGKIKNNDIVVVNITGAGKGRIEDDLLIYGKKYGFEEEVKQILNEI